VALNTINHTKTSLFFKKRKRKERKKDNDEITEILLKIG
jgi:hypothetical protein